MRRAAIDQSGDVLSRRNLRDATARWVGRLGRPERRALKLLSEQYAFSVALGDLLFLDGSWYITHTGLLRLAGRNSCFGVSTQFVREFCDPTCNRWVFKATVYKSPGSRGFVGYGDADPSNVSPVVRGAEMRVAETRAVNRALRKAYGIGLCSVEELGWTATATTSSNNQGHPKKPHSANGSTCSNNAHPPLRDQLCLLIRQYDLNPTLVKAYAAEYCGTQALKEASRDLVESFISHLAASAKEDRDGLICKLNSFAQPAEAKS